MRAFLTLALGTFLSALALPAVAGERCTVDAQECLTYMVKSLKDRGWIGLELDEDEVTGILRVARVSEGSPAESAGFKVGDELVALNGVELGKAENAKTLKRIQASLRPGRSVTYTVSRRGYKREISVTLERIPPDVLAEWVGAHMLEHSTVEVAKN